ncbi:carbohydrate esterase family 16 protein [Karstenula rhodostoma CBS 690.94]|uniref:Carbohydrate esterase family 16 protein n=1 Tax=Karstenula rhodostoma CBS 690.94 TaxID=1392251 RepID=A0A9P4PH71_9PLEO|nr:carbohydrate esterase family 16 protein [Karstenula rhodostoma CBS 690.94]
MKSSPAIALALAAYASATPTYTSHKNAFNWPSTKQLIAFGDSYTFIQGTAGHPNYSFIGDALNPAFTPADLLVDRIVQNLTGTAEGGPNWVEFLTSCGVKPGLTSPRKCKKQLWDFAYAGANTIEDASFTPLHHDHTLALEKQVKQFVEYGDPALVSTHTVKKKSDVLVAFWIGINDINDLVKLRGRNATFAPLYERVQSRQFDLVKQVYDLGYRHFLFVNLPPLDRGPSPSVNASMVAEFNTILKTHADGFQKGQRDATVLQFDVNTVLNGVLDAYRAYGFKNVTGFCAAYNQPDIVTDPGKYGCSPLDTYFWYNSGHLTSRTHEIFTGELEKFLKGKSRG